MNNGMRNERALHPLFKTSNTHVMQRKNILQKANREERECNNKETHHLAVLREELVRLNESDRLVHVASDAQVVDRYLCNPARRYTISSSNCEVDAAGESARGGGLPLGWQCLCKYSSVAAL